MIMTYDEINLTLARFARLDLPRGVTAKLCGKIDGFNVTDPKVTIDGVDGAGTQKTVHLELIGVPSEADIKKLSDKIQGVYF